jgi:pyruvate formate lyase activating enzyme
MEASYYDKLSDGSVRCVLCPHLCHIAPGYSGFCRTRRNEGGRLHVLNYGQCTAVALDPIEKKPLYHFHPQSKILSLGSWGCNLTCRFCQNWQISQETPAHETISPEQAVSLARQWVAHGNIGLAYTYNEPTVSYEFIRQTAPLIHKAGLYNVMVTNGYINEAPLKELLPFIDAWNIDLKSFTDDFYRTLCQGRLDAVRHTIELAALDSHVEVTTLIIPGQNDTPAEIAALARWLASLDERLPLHLSRYFPRYHLDTPPTPLATLAACAEAARSYLSYVHIGNISAAEQAQIDRLGRKS